MTGGTISCEDCSTDLVRVIKDGRDGTKRVICAECNTGVIGAIEESD